jgi:tellurite resistance protein
MEPPAPEAQSKAAAEALLWGGLWLAQCEGGLADSEAAVLTGFAGPDALAAARQELAAAPDAMVAARVRAVEASRRAKSLPAADRHAVVQRLVVVARADGAVSAPETAGLREIAAAMALSPQFVDKILSLFE